MSAIVRIGMGYDLHRVAPERPLVLAGVPVPADFGLAGHSDADVVIHALIDALLGAAALGDIGELFPDTDPAYAGIDSALLLSRAYQRVRQVGLVVGNVDITVVAEKPRLRDYKPAMRQRLAELLETDIHNVAVKAKTNETLGPVGEGRALACYAVVGLAAAAETK